MHFWKRLSSVLSLSFLLSTTMITTNALAADSPAEIHISSDQVAWSSAIQFREATLTVGLPDGSVFKRSFGAGDSLSFSILDAGDTQDGLYTWELTFSPVTSLRDRDTADRSDAKSTAEAVRRNEILPAAATLKDSGHFRVAGGLFVTSMDVEKTAGPRKPGERHSTNYAVDLDEPYNKQVISEDLIVDGSICVGFACEDDEVFGFDSIRHIEDNIRITAFDTSNTANFPSTDWQLTFNDSEDGGADKFSIDDITNARTPFTLLANAPSDSLYVAASGKVGIGTSVPEAQLHVTNGNTPTLGLEQDTTSGFSPQTWDIGGNESNFFIRDVTNDSALPLRIRTGAPTNSMFVDTDGSVGFGTDSPDASIHIQRTGSTGSDHAEIQTEAGGQGWKWRANAVNQQLTFIDDTASTAPFKIYPGVPSQMFVIAPTGVGIGTASPSAVLHVKKATGSITGMMTLENNSGVRFDLVNSSGGSWRTAIENMGTEYVVTKHGTGATEMRLDASGDLTVRGAITSNDGMFAATPTGVGIGTASPVAALHVLKGGGTVTGYPNHLLILQNNAATTDGAIVSIISGNANTAQLSFGDAENNFAGRFLYQHSDDSMDLQVNGADHTSFLSGEPDAIVVAAANGAHLTTGGVWTDTSSREYKTNIRELSTEDATATLEQLQPMRYNYKVDLAEEFVGFIAEDVPDLVATADRKGLSSMDIVAVLTKVVQEQQKTIDGLAAKVKALEERK